MQHSRLFILDDTPADYRPLVQVIDNFARNHKLGVMFEGRVGSGQLLVCGFDLPNMTKDPAARQLLSSLYSLCRLGEISSRPQELGVGSVGKALRAEVRQQTPGTRRARFAPTARRR